MRLDVGPETPEPGTIAMLGGVLIVGAGLGIKRYLGRGRRKEDGKGKTVDESVK